MLFSITFVVNFEFSLTVFSGVQTTDGRDGRAVWDGDLEVRVTNGQTQGSLMQTVVRWI